MGWAGERSATVTNRANRHSAHRVDIPIEWKS
jgi:hypothetical protein